MARMLRIPRKVVIKDVLHGRGVRMKRVVIPAHLTPDKGQKGRTPESRQWGEFRGNLHGWHKISPESERHSAVMRSVNAEGVNATKHKLTQLFNITTDQSTRQKARADFEWLRARYPPRRRR